MRKSLNAPFAWTGGKSKLAKSIVAQIPEHTSYVEVFGGALSVLYAKEPSKIEVINDINSDLINLHQVIQKTPESLSFYLNNMLISRETFKNIKNQSLKFRNKIERAAYFYYLISNSFGAKCDSFAMPKSRRPKNIYKNFQKYAERLKFVTIENVSFEKLIDNYDREESFFYCDPPYFKTEKYYKNTGGFGENEHKLLKNKLSNIKGKFLLSYNDCEFVRELYKDFKITQSEEIRYTLDMKKEKKVREIFIRNY